MNKKKNNSSYVNKVDIFHLIYFLSVKIIKNSRIRNTQIPKLANSSIRGQGEDGKSDRKLKCIKASRIN